MRTQLLFKPAIIIFGCFAFAACQKESLVEATANNVAQPMSDKATKPQEHKMKGEYTVGHYSFVPDMAAGYAVPNAAPGWYPGVGTEGHLNLLGKCQVFVNMYATFGSTGLQGVAAPLNLFFADQLNDMGITVPDDVAVIIFDKQGNSIWARGIGTIQITPVSATRVIFSIDNAEILGGTGKFSNASGSFIGSGYFNPQDTNEVGFEIGDGTIVY